MNMWIIPQSSLYKASHTEHEDGLKAPEAQPAAPPLKTSHTRRSQTFLLSIQHRKEGGSLCFIPFTFLVMLFVLSRFAPRMPSAGWELHTRSVSALGRVKKKKNAKPDVVWGGTVCKSGASNLSSVVQAASSKLQSRTDVQGSDLRAQASNATWSERETRKLRLCWTACSHVGWIKSN